MSTGVLHYVGVDLSKDRHNLTGYKHASSYRVKGKIYFDQWNVTQDYLFTKEQYRLNRELGIHKLNKKDNVKNFKKQWKTKYTKH